MKELVCIVCPNGCRLIIDKKGETVEVSGNQCSRGEDFAIKEMTHPMRSISSTVKTVFDKIPRVPVKVSKEIPKEKIFPVMRELNKVCIKEKLKSGDAVIENVLGLGVDVVITSDIMLEEDE
ncbi:MAG: DUF1667 domain-containing protein [Lachnospiraceae bacterium]